MELALRAPVRVKRGQEKTECRQNNILKYSPVVGRNHSGDCVDTGDSVPGYRLSVDQIKVAEGSPGYKKKYKGMWMTGDFSSE